jgi:hypothetical protein
MRSILGKVCSRPDGCQADSTKTNNSMAFCCKLFGVYMM